MWCLSIRCLVVILGLSVLAMPSARAQWAVIDAPAIVQLIKQVQAMEQQLQAARAELDQTQQAYRSMTGNRGMQTLLGGVTRNYLPSNWVDLTAAMQGGGPFPGLAADVRAAVASHAVLTPQRLATLSSAGQQQITAARLTSALQQALAQEALANASGRFASVQSLVAAIGSAGDQKAVLDLQARISAEVGMLQNEQTKLQALYQAAEAQESLNRLQERERTLVEHGSFSARFQPVP